MYRLIDLAARILHIPPRVIRFLISGGTAVTTELIFLYIFTDFFGLWYEFSLVIAFFIAFCVSFTLQKFWTFEDSRTDRMHIQASWYFILALCNLAFNAVALYLLVQYAHLWYLFAQVIISAVIAIMNFILYKFVIFKKEEAPTVLTSNA